MTTQEIALINNERLTRWGRRLVEQHSTPLLVVGCGHDEREGDVVLCLPENNVELAEALVLLRHAAKEVKRLIREGLK